MIIWINGTFGVGKTTTSRSLHEQTGWPVFDPEHVGYLVGGHLRDLDYDDFQDLPPWRTLVPKVADELMRFRGAEHLIAVQTVLRHDYWEELVTGFTSVNRQIFHAVLDCERDVLEARIRNDRDEVDALQWRLDHLDRFAAARDGWLLSAADVTLPTTNRSATEVARAIKDAVGG